MTGMHGRIVGAALRAAVMGGVLFGMGLPGVATAERGHGGDHRNRVSLHAEASRQVANDRVQVQFGLTLEDQDSVELQYRMNEIMGWATEVATHYEGVEAQTGGYRTYPVYDKSQNIDHWRATQELRVQSGDMDRVTELVRVLQTKVQLQSVNFSISPERRRAVENELIQEVIAAFKARADLVRETLEASAYEIVHLKIETSGTIPAPRQMRAMAAMVESDAAPVLEPGTSTVNIGVSGKVQLK